MPNDQNVVIGYIIELGPSVVLPIIIFFVGLLLGLSRGKAFRAALTIGVGFIAINLVVGLLGGAVGPAAQAMVKNTGIQLSALDVGWPSTSAIAYGSVVGSLAIPVGLAVNAIALITGLTATADIDLWNYWHIAFAGAVTYYVTHSFGYGILAEAIAMIAFLALADWSQPWVRKYAGFEKISFPHGTSTPYFVMALVLDKVFDRIPGLRSWHASPEALQKRFGVFGDSMVLGLLFGLLIGVVAQLNWTDVLTLGITVAAVMLVLPRMVAILMEGLVPIADSASALMQRRFPKRSVYIGMDTALLIGQPATIAASVVLVPITLGLAFVLPGNRTLPFIDLGTIPFIVALMTPVFRGNVIRTIIGGAIAMIPTLYIATALTPMMTATARQVGFDFPEGADTVTSLVDGGNVWPWLDWLASRGGIFGLTGLLVLVVVGALLLRRFWTSRTLPGVAEPAGGAGPAGPEAADAATIETAETEEAITVHPELCLVHPDADTWREVLEQLGSAAESAGFVREGFAGALAEREAQHPTGLPTSVPVAIPHADPELVLRPGLGIALFESPVEFGEMAGGDGAQVRARAAVLLLVSDPEAHPAALSRLVEVLQRPDWHDALVDAGDVEELATSFARLTAPAPA